MPPTADDGMNRPGADERAELLRRAIIGPRAPGFRDDVPRQARILRGACEEAEAPDFIEAVADWGDAEE